MTDSICKVSESSHSSDFNSIHSSTHALSPARRITPLEVDTEAQEVSSNAPTVKTAGRVASCVANSVIVLIVAFLVFALISWIVTGKFHPIPRISRSSFFTELFA